MAFRQSPSFVASGAMGIVTGLAIAGGLVFALSLPVAADQAATPAAAHITRVSVNQPDGELINRSRSSETNDLRTFGNSTARAYAMREADAATHDLAPRENGELVASNNESPAVSDPQS